MGMTLACQYMPVAKPLQKPSEALLMNCASGSDSARRSPSGLFSWTLAVIATGMGCSTCSV